MLSLEEIKRAYPESLHRFDRGLIREYLQYEILFHIFSHPLGAKLSFLGGTCLRIVHNLSRFSEDLDFDNKNLTFDEFKIIGEYVERELENRGYEVENKFVNASAFHCKIRFPELLYKEGVSPYKEEKILIQVDTFDQQVNYKSDAFILNKFDFFKQILVTPREVILSQKLWTITQRKQAKGRDFFDVMYLLQNTKPDIHFLKEKFASTDLREIGERISDRLKTVDMDLLIKDLKPFLQKEQDAERIRLFEEFLKQEFK